MLPLENEVSLPANQLIPFFFPQMFKLSVCSIKNVPLQQTPLLIAVAQTSETQTCLRQESVFRFTYSSTYALQ